MIRFRCEVEITNFYKNIKELNLYSGSLKSSIFEFTDSQTIYYVSKDIDIDIPIFILPRK